MQGKSKILTRFFALCNKDIVYISMNISGFAFAGTCLLVCGQSIIYHYFNLFKEDYYV